MSDYARLAINLKGQQYLEVKWRVVWFREEHSDGYIESSVVEHDPIQGLACFKARVGYWTPEGKEVYAVDYGSETKEDFAAGYYEKASTKAIGRALAMLGYGTAQAIELDEGERVVVDSPVERKTPQRAAPPARTPLAMVRQPVDVAELRAQVETALSGDADAAARLPKPPQEMSEEELTKTLSWLNRRARALSS